MIAEIENLLLKHFCTVPFHNLNLLYGSPTTASIPGGTCSDKTLAFLSDLRIMKVKAFLHTAYIGGKEIHRLVRINIDKHTYFADVGNGWPTIRLLPSNEDVQFESYGMKYRTEIKNNWIRVFHEKQGKESLQLEINTIPRTELEIYDQIKSRYSSAIDYPFSKSLRFSMIVDDVFLFLRGNQLGRYSEAGCFVEEVNKLTISEIIQKEFGFNVSNYFAF